MGFSLSYCENVNSNLYCAIFLLQNNDFIIEIQNSWNVKISVLIN